MHILIITAHPSSKGLTHKLAARYKIGAESAGHTVDVMDLYSPEHHLPYVHYEDYADWKQHDPVRMPYKTAIMAADRLVFIHPLWWGGPPAIMKNFLEQVLVPGFAYKFAKRMFIPQRLNVTPEGCLKRKKTTVIITFDAYLFMYALMLFPFVIVWYLFILFFCGLWRSNFHLLSRAGFRDETYRQKWLRRAQRWGQRA